ncbi:hypothetical protein VTI74DRAFT_5554 [Chaetomium olivicolor]
MPTLTGSLVLDVPRWQCGTSHRMVLNLYAILFLQEEIHRTPFRHVRIAVDHESTEGMARHNSDSPVFSSPLGTRRATSRQRIEHVSPPVRYVGPCRDIGTPQAAKCFGRNLLSAFDCPVVLPTPNSTPSNPGLPSGDLNCFKVPPARDKLCCDVAACPNRVPEYEGRFNLTKAATILAGPSMREEGSSRRFQSCNTRFGASSSEVPCVAFSWCFGVPAEKQCSLSGQRAEEPDRCMPYRSRDAEASCGSAAGPGSLTTGHAFAAAVDQPFSRDGGPRPNLRWQLEPDGHGRDSRWGTTLRGLPRDASWQGSCAINLDTRPGCRGNKQRRSKMGGCSAVREHASSWRGAACPREAKQDIATEIGKTQI